jgi:hypothetical protein
LQIGRKSLVRNFCEFVIKKRLAETLNEWVIRISALGSEYKGRVKVVRNLFEYGILARELGDSILQLSAGSWVKVWIRGTTVRFFSLASMLRRLDELSG